MRIVKVGMVGSVTQTDRIRAEAEELEMGGSERFDESYAAQLARERLKGQTAEQMVEAIISASERLAKALREHPQMTEQDLSGGPVSADFNK